MDRHFILTHGRSGSNFLANSINNHPSLVNYGEVLGEWTPAYRLFSHFNKMGLVLDWNAYLDTLYSSTLLFYFAQTHSALSKLLKRQKSNFKCKASVKSLGIKDFCFLLEKRGLLSYLQDRPDIKIIYLTRRNHLKRYLSLLNMKSSGIVKTESTLLQQNKYIIDVDDLLLKIEVFREEEMIGDRLVKSVPQSKLMTIDYEEYFFDTKSVNKTNSMIFKFLGVEEIQLASQQRKILSSKAIDHIANYAEVSSALRQAGYDYYLD